MRVNTKAKADPVFTHGGAAASLHIKPIEQLRRSVLSCMLWDKAFYENGQSIADRIKALVPQCDPHDVAELAVQAREQQHLRHAPLKLVRELARTPSRCEDGLIANTLSRIIQRADEMPEFLSMYWNGDGKKPIAKQVKKGMARAFRKFDEYQLAKYNRDDTIKLRDVLFMVHAKPKDDDQAALWKRLVDGQLQPPDTWEVALSAGSDKRATFERLMAEGKLGGMAFLRNLRNMKDAGVPKEAVRDYARKVKLSSVLPFRFIAAARAVPGWEDLCDDMLLRSFVGARKLPGKTVVVVDVSGSMSHGKVSAKSDLSRLDAAGALAAILREACEDCRLYATAGNDWTMIHATMEVPARRGMALVEKFTNAHQRGGFCTSIGGGGIFLKQCLDFVAGKEGGMADRVIVLTDEQDCDRKANPETANAFGRSNYLLNVSIEQNGIAYSKFTHINGWSEAVVQYIAAAEGFLQNTINL